MDPWRILHITDFHISNPSGEDEHLRYDYHDEYIDLLMEKVSRKIIEPLDCLVATGDFVDRGSVGNFDHVKTVLDYLSLRLGITNNRIILCNGNHDIVRDEERAGRLEEARQAFRTLAKNYANGSPIISNSRAILCKPGDDLWSLSIDTTIGCNGEDRPGTLTNLEADEIMRWIKEIPTSDLLIIASHHPVHSTMAENAAFDEPDAPDWAERHIWARGAILKERIRTRKNRPRIIWLCGDIHKSFNLVHDGIRFIATGRLGTRVGYHDSLVRRQARIIFIPRDEKKPHAILIEHNPLGHSSQAHMGRWDYVVEEYISSSTSEDTQGETELVRGDADASEAIAITLPSTENAPSANEPNARADDLPVEDTQETNNVSEVLTTMLPDEDRVESGKAENRIELISEDLQTEILRIIRGAHLYQLGRFNTSDAGVSLSWVEIGPLLSVGQTFSLVASNMVDWLQKKIKTKGEEAIDKTVILGMDCWGAVLASQLSPLTGARNFCIALRARGEHSVPAETINDEVLSFVKECETVVLVSDVVASGRSLQWIYDKVREGLGEAADKITWLALSIICDPTQNREANVSFLESHGTACNNLRMPILPSSALPDESILPPVISFQ